MAVKYIFDRIVALVGLLLLWPVLLVVWVLLKIENPGLPAFFLQKRVGRDGKLFTIVKFRTMINRGPSETTVTTAGDSRITPTGAVLRRLKLDELPELWNVLKGDMSFVGPRPDMPGYIDQLQGDDRRILQLRPGITGPATLKYRNEEELLALQANPENYNDYVIFPDKVRLNLYYLDHYSFWLDLKMIVNTVLGMRMRYAGEYV